MKAKGASYENRKLHEEELNAVSGGYDAEWDELKAWAVRHNPEWADRDPSTIGDGSVVRWLYMNIPEYDGSCQPGDHNGPTTYFVKNLGVNIMTHEEIMNFLIDKYGA